MIGEALLPLTRGKFGHARGGMLADPLQHIDQIGIRIDVVQSVGDDQALHDTDVLGAQFGPATIPVLRPIGIAGSFRTKG